jgi:ADP-ribose pyrophosphatase YjhB (NUDIX family)
VILFSFEEYQGSCYKIPFHMKQKNSFCSYCGEAFGEAQRWPRQCLVCQNISYLNPLPVAVLLLPIDNGLLFIRRSIAPNKGKLALPGGYINFGESWQRAAARELFEETGIVISPDSIEDFRVLNAPDGTILIFGLAKQLASADLPTFVPTEETSECVILNAPQDLAFPLHTQVVEEFFRRKPR